MLAAHNMSVNRSGPRTMVVSAKPTKIFQLLKIVVGDFQLYCFVEEKYVRKRMRLPTLSVEKLVKYVLSVTKVVTTKV